MKVDEDRETKCVDDGDGKTKLIFRSRAFMIASIENTLHLDE